MDNQELDAIDKRTERADDNLYYIHREDYEALMASARARIAYGLSTQPGPECAKCHGAMGVLREPFPDGKYYHATCHYYLPATRAARGENPYD